MHAKWKCFLTYSWCELVSRLKFTSLHTCSTFSHQFLTCVLLQATKIRAFFLNYFQFCTSTTYYMFCNRSLSSPLSSHFLQVAKLLEDHFAQCFDALILTFLIQENNPSDLPFPFCMELRRRATTSVSMSALMRACCFSGGFSHLPQSSCTVRSEYEKVSHLTRT